MKNVNIQSNPTPAVSGDKTATGAPKDVRITADKLFSLFTASIIKERTKFTR